jgi:RimJ/RimL family protein N-acetyltransferase
LHYDETVAAWYLGRYTATVAQSFAATARQGWERDGTHKWLAYDRASCELVGRGGVSLRHVDGQDRFEVGWALRGDMQGKLYATEIGAMGLEHAFTDCGAEEVVAFTEPHNVRSRAVMERLGMRYSRKITHLDEPFVLYELTAAEYKAAVSGGTA